MKKIMVWVLLLWVPLSHADMAADRLTHLLASLKSMRAQFTQRLVDTKNVVLQESHGRMALQRPGRFRWDTSSSGQLIIADGKNVWIYDNDLKQVLVQKQAMDSLQSPAVLLSGSLETLTKKFKIAQEGAWFRLTPRYPDAPFKAVRLQFIKGDLRAMQLFDATGYVSHFSFSRVEKNIRIPEAVFRFHMPAGVDVIDQR